MTPPRVLLFVDFENFTQASKVFGVVSRVFWGFRTTFELKERPFVSVSRAKVDKEGISITARRIEMRVFNAFFIGAPRLLCFFRDIISYFFELVNSKKGRGLLTKRMKCGIILIV